MKKPRKKYTLKVLRKDISEYKDEVTFVGIHETTAVSIRQAWNNIRFNNDFQDRDYDTYSTVYLYEVLNIEDIDPDVNVYQDEDDFLPKDGEEISLFEEKPEEEAKPLYITVDGIDYILTDNGEYTEIYD